VSQIPLLGGKVAPLPPLIDLRCCGVGDLLTAMAGKDPADLVLTDPPWSQYQNNPGDVAPSGKYAVLSEQEIADLNDRSAYALAPGGRFGMWTCWPLLVEALSEATPPPWLHVEGVRWTSGGAWHKSPHVGVGYHWRGQSEPFLLGVKSGAASGRMRETIGNGWTSEPGQHSAKPAEWLADMLRAWVPPGGLVLDLYAGVGSAAVATVLAGEGRRYMGAEIDRDRYAAACANVARTWASHGALRMVTHG